MTKPQFYILLSAVSWAIARSYIDETSPTWKFALIYGLTFTSQLLIYSLFKDED